MSNAHHDHMQVSAAQPECLLNESWTSSDPESYMRQLCTPGYYGPVCSLCVTTGNKTYGRVGTLECKPCRRTASIVSAYVASAVLVLAWLSYTIHVTLVENEEAAAGQDESQRTSQLIRVGGHLPVQRSSHCCVICSHMYIYVYLLCGCVC